MLVRMLKTMKGAPDHVSIATYTVGEVYPLPEHLAGNFLGQGVAEVFSPSQEALPLLESKMLGSAPENRQIPGAPEDRGQKRVRARKKA